jgi:hypothetical protein
VIKTFSFYFFNFFNFFKNYFVIFFFEYLIGESIWNNASKIGYYEYWGWKNRRKVGDYNGYLFPKHSDKEANKDWDWQVYFHSILFHFFFI